MYSRRMQEGDVKAFFSLDPAHTGSELIGATRAMKSWRWLLRQPGFASCVTEGDIRGKRRIVAFGASTFVAPDFAEREMTAPAPGLCARILESIDRGTPATLDESGLRVGNSEGSLTVVVLAWRWLDNLLSAEQERAVQVTAASSFVEQHAGYRLRRLLVETITPEERIHAGSVPGWDLHSDFEEYYSRWKAGPWRPGRALMVMEREKASRIPGTIGAILFNWREPELGLNRAEQQLLEAALKGMTDDELAARLRTSKAMLKRRWADMFAKVGEVRPDIVAPHGGSAGARGPQKRHRLIAYVREHPEELRPFEYGRNQAGRA